MTRSLRVLDASETARVLPWPGLIDALRDMLARRRAGITRSPERLAVPLAGGVLLAMPATDGEYASTKLVTVCPENPAQGLPSLLGEVLLMRADTGERLLMLDGPTLTARRTAAMSALAALALRWTDRSARARSSGATASSDGFRPSGFPSGRLSATDRAGAPSMLIIGSGVQARAHLEVFTEVLGVDRVLVCSRNRGNADTFATAARDQGVDCRAIDRSDAVPSEVDIVVTGTTSLQPVFEDDRNFRGFVAAVGAFRPEMCEVPASLVERAQLYIDDKPGGLHEAGDFIQAKVDWARVSPLEDAIASNETPSVEAPVVFKSVGQALWDLAASRLAARILGL